MRVDFFFHASLVIGPTRVYEALAVTTTAQVEVGTVRRATNHCLVSLRRDSVVTAL